ncbi:MAG TPA: caspase family protein [Candidatus Marinimicrobia bacterium]|nr:caspase family protein [Candidatus Neomarinimicrobiota bacterium]
MKNYSIIFSFMFVLISALMAVESDKESVNEKFQFIKDIYSESWALIIGIEDYQYVEPLSYAVDDAVDVSNILQEKYGFKEENVLLITDEEATRDNIMNGFQKILLQAGEKDRIVVFYAGHGATYPLPNGGDMGYLIPVDGDASKDNIFLTSISMSTMEELAKMSEAKHILYLVDACYGGLTLATRGLGQEQTPEYLRKMTKEKGRQVITAGGKDEKVMEKAEWGHSAFTKNLLHGLENELADANSDGIISGEELGTFIKTGVNIDTDGQHIPQKGRMGSDVGEFVFISETLENNVAGIESDGGANNDKLAAVDAELAEIKKLLQMQIQGQTLPQTPAPVIKPNKTPRMKTASTLSWVFPGMGHYYSGRAGKGFMFTSLEVISLALLSGTTADYADKKRYYKDALSNMEGLDGLPQNCNDFGLSDCYNYWKDEAEGHLSRMNSRKVMMISSGALAGVVWIWNIRDVKKAKTSDYSHHSRFSWGVNRYGQVEARIKF